MSSKFAMPNSPARPGSNRLAPGMLIGELAGRAVGPIMVHPNKPARRKKAVAVKNPANRESVPNIPPVKVCNHIGQSSRVVSVASSKAEITKRMKGSMVRSESYQPNSGPKAIRARTINGKERNRPSWEPRADHATPRAALPESSMRWPGNNDSAWSASGAPMSADGM